MKKLIPAIFIYFFTFNVSAQSYHPLVDTNKVWHQLINVWVSGMTFDDQLWIYKIEKDSVYQTNNYKILWSKQDTNSQAWIVEGLIREDSTHKVYFKNTLNTSEKLYYNFGMSVGDSIESAMNPGNYFKLESITQIPFGSGFRNQFNFYGGSDTWIEGMGSIEGLLFPFTITYVGGGFQLLCYWENDTLNYIDPTFNYCYYGNGPYNSISERNKKEISLSPNPATTSINLSMPQLTSDAEIEVFNSFGQLMMTQHATKADRTIVLNIETLPAGIYFVKMSGFTAKFVKQN